MLRITPESLDRARTLVDRGLVLIGENPLLLATRGMVSWYYVNFSIRPEERYLDEAASFVTRALDQDPGAFLGIFLRGLVAAKRGDIEAAVRDLRRARELKPGDAGVTTELCRHLYTAGQTSGEAAVAVRDSMLRGDPLNLLAWTLSAWWYLAAGQVAEAEQAVRRIIDLSDRHPARAYAANVLATLGRREEAMALYDDVALALGDTPYGSLSAFLGRALRGDADGAVGHITPALDQEATQAARRECHRERKISGFSANRIGHTAAEHLGGRMPTSRALGMVSLVVILITQVGARRTSGQAASAGADAKRFIGTWRLVSDVSTGLMYYDGLGNMAAQVMPNRSRPKYAGVQPTPEEAKEAITGYLAYFGTYTVDESVRTITHHRKANINPGQVGDDVVRAYVFGAGDRVILTPTGATNQIIWERAK